MSECPFCGANSPDLNAWQCGSCKTPDGYYRGKKCYERQLAALQARLEAAEARLRAWRNAFKIKIVREGGEIHYAVDVLQAGMNAIEAIGEIV